MRGVPVSKIGKYGEAGLYLKFGELVKVAKSL